MVEPPELLHVSYAVDHPKAEVQAETVVESDQNLPSKLESKSSLRKVSQTKSEPEVKQEAKQEVRQPDLFKQEPSKEKKDIERPPIFVTLQ